MAIVVQKFGGTSVRTLENRKAALKHILKARNEGNDVVVVVSAMGRKGDPYATDTLIQLLQAQGGPECLKKRDLIMACGEIISSAVMAANIEAAGMPAEAMTGFQAGILTTGEFGNADIIDIDPEPVLGKLREGKVVVVAGFQGRTEKGEITTLGRGGSDTTAVVLGGYLRADLVEIYTDVPGVAVTDPRIIPEAPFLTCISFGEMLTLAENGAKVIHPRAVKAAMNFNMPFRIKSTFDDGDGTLVGPKGNDYPVSGISVKDMENGISAVSVVYNECDAAVNAGAISARIESLLSAAGIPVKSRKIMSNMFCAEVEGDHVRPAVRAIFDGFFTQEIEEAG
ncbi:MAG: aspartate kinase [Tepidanaerobacteraceae bacterium]|nr:aspartate kinase [Tepidanaerobacteraceae bacterium]